MVFQERHQIGIFISYWTVSGWWGGRSPLKDIKTFLPIRVNLQTFWTELGCLLTSFHALIIFYIIIYKIFLLSV